MVSIYPTVWQYFPTDSLQIGSYPWAFLLIQHLFPPTALFHLEREDGHGFFSGMTLGLSLRLQQEQYVLCSFPFFLFISVNFEDGVSMKQYLSHHIFWKTQHSFHSAMLCDYKYILAQPGWHTLIRKGFQWPFHWNGPFICQVHYWICVSRRIE